MRLYVEMSDEDYDKYKNYLADNLSNYDILAISKLLYSLIDKNGGKATSDVTYDIKKGSNVKISYADINVKGTNITLVTKSSV